MNSFEYVRKIRDLREDHDLTQQQVADYLGTSQTMYARYERGANELPIRHLIMLCKLYHVSSDYFFTLSKSYLPISAFKDSVRAGTILFRSPTIP